MQAQIDADGVKIKVWDAENQTSDGFAGWHNPANAYEELQQAITELKEFGVEISKDNPIVMDLPYYSGADVYTNRAQTLKQSVEEALRAALLSTSFPVQMLRSGTMQVTTPNPARMLTTPCTTYPVGVLTTVIPQPTSTPCSVTAQVTWLSASVSSNTAFAQ